MNSAARGYHHGNLHDALIVAAATLIERHGSLEFSITDAARLAGVSAAAPYRHFKDKEDLLRNVRDLAFIGLRDTLEEQAHSGVHRTGSAEMIISLGQAYLRYSREKSAFFGLMWEDRGDIEQRRATQNSKLNGFYILVEAVAAYCNEHAPVQGSVGRAASEQATALTVATQLWALAHGIATLELNQMLDMFDRAATSEALLEESTRALLAGLRLNKPRRQPAAPLGQGELPL